MDNKLISIIIPVKNGHKYLGQCLECVEAQEMDVEVIVVDDGSDDDTAAIAEAQGCTVLRHEVSRGPVAAKNTGLKVARGEFVMFHDHDDKMRPGALKVLHDALVADTGVSAVEAKVRDFVSEELSEEEKKSCCPKPDPFYGLFTGAILMRKSVFDTIGLFSENVKTGEILEWQGKMDSAGLTIKKLDLVSTDRRIHNSNLGRTARKQEFKDYAAILRMRMNMKKA